MTKRYNGLNGRNFVMRGIEGITHQAMALITEVERESKEISLEMAVTPKAIYNGRLDTDLRILLDKRYTQLREECETLKTQESYKAFLEYARTKLTQATNSIPHAIRDESLTRANNRKYKEDIRDLVAAVVSCDTAYLRIKTARTEKDIRRAATIYHLLTKYSVLSDDKKTKPAVRAKLLIKQKIEKLEDTIKHRILKQYLDEDRLEEQLATGEATRVIDNIVYYEQTGVVLQTQPRDERDLVEQGIGVEKTPPRSTSLEGAVTQEAPEAWTRNAPDLPPTALPESNQSEKIDYLTKIPGITRKK